MNKLDQLTKTLEDVISNITEVYKPEIYSTDVNTLNKPMADIPTGHILNTNWDNLCNSLKLLTNFNIEMAKEVKVLLEACPHGVGEVLITSSNTNPETRWPKTKWKRITEGFIHPVIDGDSLFKTLNQTGGNYEINLLLKHLPEHGHDVGGFTDARWGFSPSIQQSGEQFKSGKGGTLWKLKTDKIGEGKPFSIVPKYITKYIWERVS
ncbi:MAG: hypothetical protein RR795_01195 [Cetobacterium sp.]|uniref:phage baseplate protein n=1 Tax=Cetobacterium sp. TaxID=2071632 RepID=UPI002FC8D264